MQAPEIQFTHILQDKEVTIRTITDADAAIEVAFVRGLSDQSRYYRFHGNLKELPPEMLAKFLNPNYPDNMALIATLKSNGGEQQIAVARYSKTEKENAAELAVVVADAWQGRGLGRRIMLELVKLAIQAGFKTLYMSILSENIHMIKLATQIGFTTELPSDDYVTRLLCKSVTQQGLEHIILGLET